MNFHKLSTMTNLTITRKGNILTIVADLSKPGKESFTGKSLVIASTNGNVPVEGKEEIFCGVNIYKKKR